MKCISDENYGLRLNVCSHCAFRERSQCSLANFRVTVAARDADQQCPHSLWPALVVGPVTLKAPSPVQQAWNLAKSLQARKLDHLLNGCTECLKMSAHKQRELLEKILRNKGPGSQLWNIFSRLGIQHDPNCSCILLADVMNDLGPQGCIENKPKLLKLMRKNQEKYGWSTYLKAGINATVLGWTFKLNPLDPLPGLFDMAIDLANKEHELPRGAVV